jgi:hypothetical protein
MKLRSIIILAAIPIALLFQGCGPSAKELAKQKAIGEFREAIAAVKVCTQDTTYQEFREKRLALETCYTANRSDLAEQSGEIDQLVQAMKATDLLWDWQIQFPNVELPAGGTAKDPWILERWNAMLAINPGVAAKANFTPDQCRKDPDFYAANYSKLGLLLISKDCDQLLTEK